MAKRIVVTVVVCLAVVIVGFLVFRAGHGPSSKGAPATGSQVIKIGVVLPLSGSMAEYGNNGRDGLLLAKEDLAREGVDADLLIQDSKDVPEGTVTSVKRLIDVDGVKYIIGGLTSAGVLAAAPYAQQKGVLFFTPAASAPGIPEIGDLVFRNWQSDTALATMFGKAAFEKLKLRNVAILSVSNDYGNTNSATFASSFKAAGGQVALQRSFPQGTTDFRDLVTKVRALSGIDSLLIIAYPDEYRAAFGEIKAQSLKGAQLLTSDTLYSPQMLADLGSAAEGTVCAVAAKPGEDYEPRKKFIAAYKARFGKDVGLVSDTAYDALRLVVSGIRATDGAPKSVSRWLLAQRDYPGVAGKTTFTPTGDFQGGMTLYRVQGGKFVEIGS
ncbi:MAG TPA: penicillin-binding protein activator [Burkholderiales bacterium]|nr:penicillin-binding protein activator [Burkholderiales bacterium]